MSHDTRTVPPRNRRFGSRAALVGVAVLLTPLAQACEEEGTDGPGTQTYITEARLLGAEASAVLHNDFLPEGSADGPEVTVEEESTIINGGSLQVPVTASAAVEELLVGVTTVEDPAASSEAEAGPVRGYYEISLPEPTTEATVVLTVAQNLPVTSVVLDIAAVGGGTQGAVSHQTASAVSVGSGELQVSVSWDSDSDTDLHVVDANGDEIYYGAQTAASGGALDLDSNANCSLDHVRNENITFSDAPPGEYTVRVDYYDACDVEETNYVVTVQLPGQAPQVFNGTFTGEGDNGGEGDGELITTFTIAE
jgi:hypothetical protein